ncbi:Cysteine proteinase inhibitor 6-like protein [Drosera capensis]
MNAKSSISILLALIVLLSICELGFCRYGIVTIKRLGAAADDLRLPRNDAEIELIARFAVDEHNKKENGLLVFARVLKVKEQVVAGKLYHLTLEAVDAGKKKIYEAKVWVKPWTNFKQLQEFKQRASDHTLFTSADLGFVRGPELLRRLSGYLELLSPRLTCQASACGQCSYLDMSIIDTLGWREVPTRDPGVQDAADQAVKTITRMSNSIFPYLLLEILQAKAEVFRDYVKYNLLLKLKRDVHEEKFEVEVQKTLTGKFVLKLLKRSTA